MKNIILILTSFILIASCEKEDSKEIKNSFSGNWKLTSFVNQSTNSIQLESDFINSNEITISFGKELDFSGNTVLNNFSGKYSIKTENNDLIFLTFSTTEVNESEWGNLFYQSLNLKYNQQTKNWEYIYEIENNELKIFYSEQEYMSFEKLE